MRLDEFSRDIKEALFEAGVPEAENETRIILREICGISSGEIFSHPEKNIAEDKAEVVQRILKRRKMREPLQYILGKWDFMGLNFKVSEGVLIPRPDTEILVECVMKELHDGMRFLDLCTGTGCIAISLLAYSNCCEATAVDISETAAGLATDNARALLGDKTDTDGLPKLEHLKIKTADLFEGADGKYDIIVSNPPYINTGVIATLEKEVCEYEPWLALDGGEDGLDIIRRIISNAPEYLTSGGKLFMEIGCDQGEIVADLMKQAGFKYVDCVKDYAGLDRVVHGEWVHPV